MTRATQDLPLAGIRVIDLTRILSGPFCTMLLGDLGAEVIKIEPPEGDPLRGQGEMVNGLSWYFAMYNRNKRSVVLDLYSDEGKATLAGLIRGADVLVENYRPGVLQQMGFSQSRLDDLNPRLIVASVTGFGNTGPYADRPAFDFIAQAMSGYMSVNGEAGGAPLRTGIPLSDLLAGLYAALGVVAALRGREHSGKGQEVSVSLLGGLVSFLSFMAANHLATGALPQPTGNDHPLIAPYGLYATADGAVAIAPSTEAVYRKLLAALGLTHIAADARFCDNAQRMANRPALRALIEGVTRAKSRVHWIGHLNAAGVPCGPVLDLAQMVADPQVRHEQLVVDVPHPGRGVVRMTGFPIKFSDTPLSVRHVAPELGADTVEILGEHEATGPYKG